MPTSEITRFPGNLGANFWTKGGGVNREIARIQFSSKIKQKFNYIQKWIIELSSYSKMAGGTAKVSCIYGNSQESKCNREANYF